MSFHKGTLAIELGHPSAHSSPQSKWQMDMFSRFCTAYGRKCLYFKMGAPIHQNCPFPWGIWTSHVTRDDFSPCEATTQTAPQSVQSSLHRWPWNVYSFQWFACFPLKTAPSHVGISTSCNTWFIGPTRVRNANGNLIFSAVFLQGSLVWQTHTATERPTDRPCCSVRCRAIIRNYVGYSHFTLVLTISPLLSRHLLFKTFNKISRWNSYILFGSVHCSRQSSNWNIYIYMLFRYTI